ILQLSPIAGKRVSKAHGEVLSSIACVLRIALTVIRFRSPKQVRRILERIGDTLAAHGPGDEYLPASLIVVTLPANQPSKGTVSFLSDPRSNPMGLAGKVKSPAKGEPRVIIR